MKIAKITFIVWERYHRRSELLAQHLSTTIHYVHCGQKGRILQAPVRFLIQALRTWGILAEERPDVILVQNPPIFAVLIAFLYAHRYRARYVIDSHTGAFLSWKWRWSLWLHRMFSRRALMTIVHNKDQEEIVKRWGCPYFVLSFTPGEYPVGEHLTLGKGLSVVVISTYGGDEPLDVIFEAARRMPDVSFYVTGNSKRIHQGLLTRKPENCFLTGYLSYAKYVALLRGADAIMDLTSQDHTLLMGGFEAVSIGKPLITSNWPVLKDYFCLGTVHINNTVEGVCEGVLRTQAELDTLRRNMLRLRKRLQSEWDHKLIELSRLLTEH